MFLFDRKTALAALLAIVCPCTFSLAADDEQITRLIEQLADPVFSVREAAAEQLLAEGEEVADELQQSLGHVDLEIRLRSHQLLTQLREQALERKLAAFIADEAGTQEHNLPGWQAFQKAAGSDAASRRLFAGMIRSEGELLTAYNQRQKNISDLAQARAQELQQQSRLAAAVPVESVAALLLIGGDPAVPDDARAGQYIYSLLYQTSGMQAINQGSYSPVMKQLLSRWILRPGDASRTNYSLMLALRYDMPETGLQLGRSHLKDGGVSSYLLQYSALLVAKYGDEEDIPHLAPHLENNRVCHSWQNGKELIKIQIRDVVLATLIKLTAQKHEDYGFKHIRPNEQTVWAIYTLGFVNDAEREAAHAKWKAWVEEQKQ